MPKKFMEPEEIMDRKMKRLALETKEDVYDVLGHLFREFGPQMVTEQLSLYVRDQAETAFGSVGYLEGREKAKAMATARAWDVCAAMAESLKHLAEEYEL
jgi:hypothetical protein